MFAFRLDTGTLDVRLYHSLLTLRCSQTMKSKTALVLLLASLAALVAFGEVNIDSNPPLPQRPVRSEGFLNAHVLSFS